MSKALGSFLLIQFQQYLKTDADYNSKKGEGRVNDLPRNFVP